MRGNSTLHLKQILKKFPPIYSLNAKLKARKTIRSYHALSEHYEKEVQRCGLVYREEDVAIQVSKLLKQRGIYPKPLPKGNLRIFYVGTVPEQDYGGIIQGLQKFGEVILFKNKAGIYGQMWPSNPKNNAAQDNGKRLLDIVHNTLKSGPLHVIIGQMWGHTINPDALKKLQEMRLIIVNISMDDRHAFRGQRVNDKWSGTAGLIGFIDLACTAAKECCLWYLVEGCPSIYLPEASDPELFRPSNEHKLYDVSFVGKAYGIRSKIVKAIERTGVHVECFGTGSPNGMISTEKMPELFALSRIVLGVGTISHCTDFYALKMRDFDGPMSGSLYLTHHNPDLEDLYIIGKEIETYKTPEECAQKVRYYLDHPDEAEAIGRAGRERAVKDHTWEKRFEKVLRVIGLIETQ